MTKETKRLIEAFAVKDRVEGFISNLKELKAEGSVSDEQYAAAKAEYEQSLSAAKLEIDQIKTELKQQLGVIQRDIETYRLELENLEARYKADELPLNKYQSSDRKLRATIEGLEQHAEELKKLVKAKSSADADIQTKKPGIATAGLPSATRITPAGRGVKLPGSKWLAMAGGAVVVIAIIVAVVLLTSGGVKEVRVPIEVKDAASVGSLHLELVYDGGTLNAVAVESGTAVGDALFEYNINTPGQLIVGLVSSRGISQDGSVAIVTFEVTGKSKTGTPLSLENVVAYDADTLNAIPASASAGSVVTKDGSFTPPTLLFQPQATE